MHTHLPENNTQSLIDYYGPAGSAKHQTLMTLPFTMVLGWQPETIISRVTVNKKAKEPLENALEAILDHYGMNAIEELNISNFSGLYSNRKIRNGSRPSVHAFSAAIDLFYTQNRLRWDHTKAAFAQDAYIPMHECFEEQGFQNIGRLKDYDWTHFQLTQPW